MALLATRQPLFAIDNYEVLSSVSGGATNDEEAAVVNADSGAPIIQAPIHVLVIPESRDGLTELGKAENTHQLILGRLLYAAKIVAEKEGIVNGFRVVINSGTSACQATYHLHLHVLGGRQMEWPPG
ncbi:Histidine triad nucleotide-binding protein 1 [Orobanche gracilis]